MKSGRIGVSNAKCWLGSRSMHTTRLFAHIQTIYDDFHTSKTPPFNSQGHQDIGGRQSCALCYSRFSKLSLRLDLDTEDFNNFKPSLTAGKCPNDQYGISKFCLAIIFSTGTARTIGEIIHNIIGQSFASRVNIRWPRVL